MFGIGKPKGTFASTKATIPVKARGPKRRGKRWRAGCRGRVCASYSQACSGERETHSLSLHTPSPKYKNPSPQPWISPAEPPLGPTPTTSTPCPTLLRTVTGNMDLVLRLHLSGWKSFVVTLIEKESYRKRGILIFLLGVTLALFSLFLDRGEQRPVFRV
jgi:hypothetical protein